MKCLRSESAEEIDEIQEKVILASTSFKVFNYFESMDSLARTATLTNNSRNVQRRRENANSRNLEDWNVKTVTSLLNKKVSTSRRRKRLNSISSLVSKGMSVDGQWNLYYGNIQVESMHTN